MEKRPLTKDEIKYLKSYFGKSPNDNYVIILNSLFGYGLLTGLIYTTLYLIAKHILFPIFDMGLVNDYKSHILIISMIIGLIIAFPMIKSILEFKQQSNRKLNNAIKTNQAEIYNLSISRAAELEEYEDEGVGFFLETDDNRVLFIRGQDLYDYASDSEDENESDSKIYGQLFPSTKLTLIREPILGIRLNIIPEGDEIKNILKLKRKSFIKKGKGPRKYIGPDDGAFYDGNLEDVLKKFSISPLK